MFVLNENLTVALHRNGTNIDSIDVELRLNFVRTKRLLGVFARRPSAAVDVLAFDRYCILTSDTKGGWCLAKAEGRDTKAVGIDFRKIPSSIGYMAFVIRSLDSDFSKVSSASACVYDTSGGSRTSFGEFELAVRRVERPRRITGEYEGIVFAVLSRVTDGWTINKTNAGTANRSELYIVAEHVIRNLRR
ncbi:MAG: hypothetical protein PVI21_06105 [Candidatus Woesebacteria bacterium]|jgi:hypothetical protein